MIINDKWMNEIHSAIEKTIEQARAASDVVQFEFNGVTVRVAGDSSPYLIYRDWSRGMSGYLGEKPTVGPYPWLVLSETALASDAKIERANEERRKKADEEYAKREQAKRLFLKDVLLGASPLELKDAEGFAACKAANSDPYGAATVAYAETWGRVMQVKMASGSTLEDIADESSSAADVDGITGFMYGCAVSILAGCWVHGERLRRWHNKGTQLGNEGDKANESGGVLNPALMSIR